MADILLLILGILLIVISILGSFLPILPGPPLGLVGMFLLRFTSFVEATRKDYYDNLLWIFLFVTVIVTFLDYIVPIWGAKKFGGSSAGMWGAGIGVIAGLFFAPIGLIVMPFLGAVIGEMMTGRDERSSFRAGFGSFIGFLTGVLIKVIACILMAFYFIKEIFVTV